MKLSIKSIGRILSVSALLFSTVGMMSAEMMRLPGSNTRLGAAKVYSSLWAEKDAAGNYLYPITSGIYTIPASEKGDIVQAASINDMSKVIAAVKINSLYYTVSITGSAVYFSKYSTSTWNRSSQEEIDEVNMPVDLTYDPVTDKCYGFFYNESDGGEYSRFCSFSTSTAEATDIAELTRPGFAIAANQQGELYAIWGYTGWLIKIDPKTGQYEQIGRTGIYPGDPGYFYRNSMTFDDETGKLYWSANDDEGNSALYEINTETGAATLIRSYENQDTYIGLFAYPYEVPTEAPAACTDARIEYTSFGALTGYVKCVAPDKDMSGAALTGTITAIVSVNGSETVVEGVVPGEEMSTELLTFPAGEITVDITFCTDEYLGDTVSFSSFAGIDTPASPSDLLLSDLDGVPHLSWKAPTSGVHGGEIKSEELSYRIVRYPGETVVAEGVKGTQYDDTAFSGMAVLRYEVTACTEAGESEAVTSNKLAFGSGFTIPFTASFDTEDDFDVWTVEDLNGGSTWQYNATGGNIYYKYNDADIAGDDWIISPKFSLEEGRTYELTFFAKSLYQKYPENFKFALGTSATSSSMTTEIVDIAGFSNTKGESRRVLFRAPATGEFYLGLYCYSYATGSSKGWTLTIDDISMDKVSGSVPTAVEELQILPAAQGALSADISFKAPTKDADGEALKDNITVALYRADKSDAIATFADVAPGADVSYKDTDFSDAALYTYRVVPSNELGIGEETQVQVFVGEDLPGGVQSLSIKEYSDRITLSWEAPAAGVNGGWFNPETVVYKVTRSDGEVLAADLAACEYSDTGVPSGTQDLRYYLVQSYSGGKKGGYANTDYDVYGAPYTAPIAETFPAADMSYYPWVSESDGPVYIWTLETSGSNPVAADYNGDKGLAMFVSTEDTAGITGTFSSPKFDISSLENPELSFAMYHSEASADNDEVVKVLVKSGDNDWREVGETTRGASVGWQRHTISLADYAGAASLRVRFSIKALGGGNIHLDNIAIDEQRGKDLAAVSISGPAHPAHSYPAEYTVRVQNVGSEAIASAKVLLNIQEENIDLEGREITDLAVGEMREVAFNMTFPSAGTFTLQANVVMEGDENIDNDDSLLKVTAMEPVIPTPQDLTAVLEGGNLLLSWKSPYSAGAVTDDVEDYEDWAIDGIGDWTMVDQDMDVTYFINKDLENYPNMTDAKAFQVCNAETLGINIWDEGTPHSGDKMFMCVASYNKPNDDWMISPQLNGKAQTVSFYAKSFTTDGINPERMRVLYSMNGTNPTDFVKISSGEYIEVPAEWTEYRYSLPEGAKHFAINCVSDDSFALFIDDISMNDMTVPALDITGYNVYRDGVQVATVDSAEYSETAFSGKHSYAVAACYSTVVSGLSESVSVESSGVEGILEETQEAVYYNLQGVRVSHPERGIYIRVVDGKSAKVAM